MLISKSKLNALIISVFLISLGGIFSVPIIGWLLIIVVSILNFVKIPLKKQKISYSSFVGNLILIILLIYIYINSKHLNIDYIYGDEKLFGFLYLTGIVIAIFLFFSYTKIDYTFFILAFYIFNVILVFYVLIINFQPLMIAINQGARPFLGEYNPIWLSRIAGQALVISLFLKVNKKIFYQLIIIVNIVLILFMISMGSKGPIISIIIVWILYKMKDRIRLTPKDIIKTIIFIITSIIILNYSLNELFNTEYLKTRFLDLDLEVENGRWDRYVTSFGLISQNIIFGIGWGNYNIFINGEFGRDYPHNIYFEVLLELGTVGLIFLIFYLYQVVKVSIKLKKHNASEVSLGIYLFIYYLINACVSGDFGPSNIYVFVFASYLLAQNQYLTIDKK